MTAHILIVDDEQTLRYFLRLHLEAQGYRVTEAADGQTALGLVRQMTFAVALVDLRLTDMDGLEVVSYLRQTQPETSVIIMTAYASLDSAIMALRQGAHDYVTKPFKMEDLLASVADSIARQSALPAPSSSHPPTVLTLQDLELNQASRELRQRGTLVNLTPTEFDILSTLMIQPDVALDAISLVQAVRGYEATEADARAIARVHVHRLRQKIEPDPGTPRYVKTVAGGRYLVSR